MSDPAVTRVVQSLEFKCTSRDSCMNGSIIRGGGSSYKVQTSQLTRFDRVTHGFVQNHTMTVQVASFHSISHGRQVELNVLNVNARLLIH